MRALCVCVVAAAACGFVAERGDGGARDLAGEDLSLGGGPDLLVPDLLVPDGGFACAHPQLLVTVENLANGAVGGGRVARFALGDGSAPPAACATIDGQGALAPQPFAVAEVGGKLAVAARGFLHYVDPDTNTIVWSVLASEFPIDVFPLERPGGAGEIGLAVSTGATAPPLEVAQLLTYTVDASADATFNLDGTQLPLGSGVLGMSAQPRAPTHLYALEATTATVWDVDPWAASKTAYRMPPGTQLLTTAAVTWQSLLRSAWVDGVSPTSVYYANDDGTTNGTLGPVRCGGCTLLYAVPDPTINTRFFGLCDGPTVSARRVVRFSSDGSGCDTVLDGAAFGGESRMSRLAISE